MICEEIDSFTDGLIEKTRAGRLNWQPLTSFYRLNDISREFEAGFGDIDFRINTIRESSSYFLKHKDGYVFLFEIYHGDESVMSPDYDNLALMVKVNSVLPIDNLSSHMGDEEHPQKLARLKLLIEHYLEEKYQMPDTLYKFMDDVLGEDSEDLLV